MSIRLNQTSPFTPFSRAANMRSVQADACTHDQRDRLWRASWASATCLASIDTDAALSCIELSFTHPFFLRPLAPRPLRRFIATTDALTPAGAGSSAGAARMNSARLPPAGLSDSRSRTSDRSASSHLVTSRRCFDTLPISPSSFPFQGLGLATCQQARHFTLPNRVHLTLRTSRSPPVALHLASRPRSYLQFRAGECMPGEDLHLSVLERSQTHWHGHPARVSPGTPGTL